MKISRILSASVLAGAVLFSATACGMSSNDKPDINSSDSANSSAAAKPAETQAVKTTPAVDESSAAAVAEVVNGYYTYVSTASNRTEIEKAGEPLKGHGIDATDDELQQLVNAMPQGFQYFDTSSPNNIKNAYAQLIMGSTVMGKGSIEVNVPASAVTVEGDTATVQTTKIEFTVNGEKSPVSSTSGTQILNLKKDASGSWVMIPEDFLSQVEKSREVPSK